MVAAVIPAVDHLNMVLTDASINENHSAAVRAVFNLGKQRLNRSYELTDESLVYRFGIRKLLSS